MVWDITGRIWSVNRGQYDDLEGDAHRIVMDEDNH
ncbi:MAG: cbb3-type cytochrome oxidase assembly protein CcoS [Gammaproteobacteria bacterium]|nr:cbb3-type cytochrome oxidase assembly protein CcoS [Gammaproteobacteria bacterium]